MERCRKCILPVDYPGVTLDDNDVCNYCNSYKSLHTKLGAKKLLIKIRSSKNSSGYDCVVPISGGKDSTFILYYVVKKLGLKPLAVNYNSGLQNSIAGENIKEACRSLNVKLISQKSRFSQRLIRQILLIAIKEKSRPQLRKLCRNCETMLRSIAIKSAKKYKIENIIWGSSALESGTNKRYLDYKSTNKNKKSTNVNRINYLVEQVKKLKRTDNKMEKIIRRINKHLFGWPVLFRHLPSAILFNIISVMQRFEMGVPFRYAIFASKLIPFSNSPNFIHFFDFVEWDSMDNVKILKEEVNWRHPEGKEDRFDCLYHSLPNLYSLKFNKITADGINYCNFIRENKITRDEALEREAKLRKSVKEESEEILKNVGLTDYTLP